MHRLLTSGLVLAVFLLAAAPVLAHCQVPCGIYDDELRVRQIEEHVRTIEKAMKQVTQRSGEQTPNFNQITRWVATKDGHAQEIQTIVAEYFLAQRIKSPKTDDTAAAAAYQQRLAILHQMIVAAMKAKQTTDLKHVETLRKLTAEFRTAYFGESKAAK